MARGSAYRKFQIKRCIPAAFESGWDARSNTPPRTEFLPALSAQSCWRNTPPIFHLRRKFPAERLLRNSPAKGNSKSRHREDFFLRELPAAAAYLDSRRGERGWRFAAQKASFPALR